MRPRGWDFRASAPGPANAVRGAVPRSALQVPEEAGLRRIIEHASVNLMVQADEQVSDAPIAASEREKYCRGCSRWLALWEFSTNDRSRGTTHSRCRACCRERSHRHYTANRHAYLERNRRNQPRLKRALHGLA